MNRLLTALILAFAIILAPACTTLPDGSYTPNRALIQTGATLATTGALSAVPPAKRAAIKPKLYAVAGAVRALSGGQAPSPGQVADILQQWTDPDPLLVITVQGLAALYAQYFPSIKGNPAAALAVLESIARGVEAGAIL